MKSAFGMGLAALSLLVGCAAATTTVNAGGLFDRGARGSLKDGAYAPRVHHRGSAGKCYVRGDVGYSHSSEPDVRWPVTSFPGGAPPSVYLGDTVSNVEIENTWVGEIGLGCGTVVRGFRADVTFGYRGERKIDGEPLIYEPNGGAPVIDDPLHTSLSTYTGMVNIYYDLGRFRNFAPYVGAGVGVAYHRMAEVYFTENPNLVNRIEGNEDATLAWSLQAGTGYQISDRTILDFGYRYINLGRIKSGRVDSANFVNPPVKIDDITAHEFKVGFRYHFGHSGYSSLK